MPSPLNIQSFNKDVMYRKLNFFKQKKGNDIFKKRDIKLSYYVKIVFKAILKLKVMQHVCSKQSNNAAYGQLFILFGQTASVHFLCHAHFWNASDNERQEIVLN